MNRPFGRLAGFACAPVLALGMSAAVIAQEALLPLDARLGGTVEGFEAEYGEPLESSPSFFTEYGIEGFGTVFADELEGRIERISLFSPRPAGVEWENDVPHESDWTILEANQLAEHFLPLDGQLDQPSGPRLGVIRTVGYSPAPAAEVPESVYAYVDNAYEVGQFSYVIMPNADETGGNNISIEPTRYPASERACRTLR